MTRFCIPLTLALLSPLAMADCIGVGKLAFTITQLRDAGMTEGDTTALESTLFADDDQRNAASTLVHAIYTASELHGLTPQVVRSRITDMCNAK